MLLKLPFQVKQYIAIKQIGKGAFGSVYKGISPDGIIVAIKLLSLPL